MLLPKITTWNWIYAFVGMTLLIFVEQLRLFVLTYLALYFIASQFGSNYEEKKEPFLQGLKYSAISLFLSLLIFSSIGLEANEPLVTFGISTIWLVLYYFFIAGIEEDVFRDLLIKRFKSPLFAQLLFAFWHLFVIAGILATRPDLTFQVLLDPRVQLTIGFTFGFGLLMYWLTTLFRSTTPAKIIHWQFNLFKVGLIYSVLKISSGGTL